MLISSWLTSLVKKQNSHRTISHKRVHGWSQSHSPRRQRPIDPAIVRLEQLEERALLSALTVETIAEFAQAGIERWEQAGLSAEQLQALQGINYNVDDLPSHRLGVAQGLNAVLESAKLLASRETKVQILFIGDGPVKAKLQKQAEDFTVN